ncbi:MAG: alginate lyase family protein [Chlorobium sp.]
MRYFYTIRHLKLQQLYYQVYYRAGKKIKGMLGNSFPLWLEKEISPLRLLPCIQKFSSFDNGTFSFLNLSQSFGEDVKNIDWEFRDYGKLWEYNLNYFDFLLQPGMTKESGVALIESFLASLHHDSVALESYPVSLRGINWIKFLSFHSIHSTEVNGSLFVQYKILEKNIEYHLLGNHLLENAFSLLFGAFFFQEPLWFEKSSRLLSEQLEEQILDDGAHFELSPMYHKIILDRLLDCINLLQNNKQFYGQDKLFLLLSKKASVMLSWLKAISFSNSSIPYLNDAVDDIAPINNLLFEYALRLGVKNDDLSVQLKESGYRKHSTSLYECIVDVGIIGPKYIAGHAHADTMSFVLNIERKAVIVDTGISTYEKNSRREEERSTAAHNTVEINGFNSSDVWGGFRVGKRSEVKIIDDNDGIISAEHDGYKKFKVTHKRQWQFFEDKIVITDHVSGKDNEVKAYLHFDCNVYPELSGNVIFVDNAVIVIDGAEKIEIKKYFQAVGYNRTVESMKAVISFNKTLVVSMLCNKL